MATSSAVMCGICDAQHVTKCADYWCPECEEGLCSECHRYHSFSRGTRNHQIIPVENYNKISEFIKDVSDSCKEHELKYTNYCSRHITFCCPVCITIDHSTCINLSAIPNLIENSKTSSLISILKERLKDIWKFMDTEKISMSENFVSFQQKRQQFQDKVKEIRGQINNHLDGLELTIYNKLDNAEQNTKEHTENMTTLLSVKSERMKELEYYLTALVEFGSNTQTLFGSREIQVEMEEAEKYLMSISKDGSLDRVNLICSIDDKITNLISNVTSMGSATVETNRPLQLFSTATCKQVQMISILRQSPVRLILDINFALISTFNEYFLESHSDLRGCMFFSEDKMLFSDNKNKRLIILNRDGSLDNPIYLPSFPKDITMLDHKTVAVSTDKGIYVVNTESLTVKQEIPTDGMCYGVTNQQNLLLWCEESKGIQSKLLPDGEVTTLLHQDDWFNCSYLTSFGSTLYQTNPEKETVTCYTIQGKKQWEYKDENILSDPTCITIDDNCNVYVTSALAHKVVVISSDGNSGTTLIDEEDGLLEPWGICYDKSKGNLLLANKFGPAFIYERL